MQWIKENEWKLEKALEYCKTYNLPYKINSDNVICVNSKEVHHTHVVKLAKIYGK